MATVEKRVIAGYGMETYVLNAFGQTVKILPERGANAWFYEAAGYSWLIPPFNLMGGGSNPGVAYGIPILFPTPNRVPDGRYQWQGQSYTMRKNGVPYWIHGLISDEPFVAGQPVLTTDRVQLPLHYTISPETPWWESFPFACLLEVCWTLDQAGLLFSYTVFNQGDGALPFGIGLHPYFRKVVPDTDILLRVPAERVMVRDAEKLPTGALLNVADTGYDLRHWSAVSGLALDDVYFGMTQNQSAHIQYRGIDREMTLTASDSFGHLVVFTPQGSPIFCVENQSCSTNAINRYAQGQTEACGLIIVPPGDAYTGWVRFSVSTTNNPHEQEEPHT